MREVSLESIVFKVSHEDIRTISFIPIRYLFVQSQQMKHQKYVSNMFKVNNKDIKITSFIDLTHCSGASIVCFKQNEIILVIL